MADWDRFKREIDLRRYAESLGYQPDKEDSWQGEYVMRKGADKVSITLNRDNGHWLYYSLRGDPTDQGSIVDFVGHRVVRCSSLDQMEKELNVFLTGRAWKPPAADQLFGLRHTPKDFEKVRRVWHSLTAVPPHEYLEGIRKIPTAVLLADRFFGCVRGGNEGVAAFPHYAVDGTICGIEFKGPGTTRFIAGGRKTIWRSNRKPEDNALIVCESGLECLSYAALFPDDHFRYISTAGSVSSNLPELRQVVRDMPPESDIVAAMNEDEAGRLWTKAIQDVFRIIGRQDLNWRCHFPESTKDWNEELKNRVEAKEITQ